MKKPYIAIVDDTAFSSYVRTFLSLRDYKTRAWLQQLFVANRRLFKA